MSIWNIGLTVLLFVLSGYTAYLRTRMDKIEDKADRAVRDLAEAKLRIAEDYVRQPQVEAALAPMSERLGKVEAALDSAVKLLHEIKGAMSSHGSA